MSARNLSTNVVGNGVKVEYVDNSNYDRPVYSSTFTLDQLRRQNRFFYLTRDIYEVDSEFKKAISRGKTDAYVSGNNAQVTFNLILGTDPETVRISLPKEYKPQPKPQPKLRSTPPKQSYRPAPQPVEKKGPTAHERIAQLEKSSNQLNSADSDIQAKIDKAKQDIEDLKRRARAVQNENDEITRRTGEIKDKFSKLVDSELRLREWGDVLKRDNQQLKLKIAQLEFLLGEQKDKDGIKEVTVPFDGRASRPSSVSKSRGAYQSGLYQSDY